jgi:hypothetical protein
MKFHFLLEELNDQNPKAVNDQHTLIVFAQGLKELDIPFSGNRDFLQDYEASTFLIPKGPVDPSAVLVTINPQLFEQDLATLKNPLIIFNIRDEWNAGELDRFIPRCQLYFRSSFHLSNQNPKIKPFAFALSNRILEATEDTDMSQWSERELTILEAHRVTDHDTRILVKCFYKSGECPIPVTFYNDQYSEPTDPLERFLWGQSGRRHSMAYYDRLKSVQMLDAHGGYMKPTKLVQIDSWKLWEGFAAGCLVIAPDFKLYGIKMPYDLIAFKHYFPIRYDKLKDSYELLSKLTEEQKRKIAREGRLYVRRNYGPEGMAKYVLGQLENR